MKEYPRLAGGSSQVASLFRSTPSLWGPQMVPWGALTPTVRFLKAQHPLLPSPRPAVLYSLWAIFCVVSCRDTLQQRKAQCRSGEHCDPGVFVAKLSSAKEQMVFKFF